jgi:hypothetical protein
MEKRFLGESMTMPDYPDNNPKTLAGANRLPLHLVPPSAISYLAEAMADGGRKYGPYNWRESPISVSTYIAAATRHMHAYWDGEDFAKDSGVHHLAHAMACFALLLDAYSLNVLVDDRPPKGKAADIQAAYANKNKEVVKDAAKQEFSTAGDGPVNRYFDALVNGGLSDNEENLRSEDKP